MPMVCAERQSEWITSRATSCVTVVFVHEKRLLHAEIDAQHIEDPEHNERIAGVTF